MVWMYLELLMSQLLLVLHVLKYQLIRYLKAMGQVRVPELVHKYLVWTQVQRKT